MSLTDGIGVHRITVSTTTHTTTSVGIYERTIYPKGDGLVMFFMGKVRPVMRDTAGNFTASVDLRDETKRSEKRSKRKKK